MLPFQFLIERYNACWTWGEKKIVYAGCITWKKPEYPHFGKMIFFVLLYIIITTICYTVYSLCIVKLICNLNSIISWGEGRSFLFCIFNYWGFSTMKSLCFIQDSLVINSVESASQDGQWASQALTLCLHYLLTVPALSSMHSEMLCGS